MAYINIAHGAKHTRKEAIQLRDARFIRSNTLNNAIIALEEAELDRIALVCYNRVGRVDAIADLNSDCRSNSSSHKLHDDKSCEVRELRDIQKKE